MGAVPRFSRAVHQKMIALISTLRSKPEDQHRQECQVHDDRSRDGGDTAPQHPRQVTRDPGLAGDRSRVPVRQRKYKADRADDKQDNRL